MRHKIVWHVWIDEDKRKISRREFGVDYSRKGAKRIANWYNNYWTNHRYYVLAHIY